MDAALDLGLELDIVTPQFMVAEDIDVVRRVPLYERLLSAGTRFYANSEVVETSAGMVTLRNVYSFAETSIGPADLMVVWDGRRARDELRSQAEELGLETHVIGDALAPRTAEFAIAEGAMLARRI